MDIEQQARKIIARSKLAVSGDGGHNTTFAVACSLAKLSGEEETLMRWLRAYNERLDDQWTERELYHKAEGAVNAVSRTRKTSRPKPLVAPAGNSKLWRRAKKEPLPCAPKFEIKEPLGGPAVPDDDDGDNWSFESLWSPPPQPAYAYAGII